MFGLQFEFAKVTALQFWLTLGVGAVIIVCLVLYLGIFVWIFGKPMRLYLTSKFNPGTGIIQEYRNEHVTLKLAKVSDGIFTDLEASKKEKIPTGKKYWQIWKPKYTEKIISSKPIVAQSIISVNGVDTLMLWNVNPKLPDNYINCLKALTKMGYNKVSEIREDIKSGLINLDVDVNGIKLSDFFNMHEKIVNRNAINVTPEDVLNFSDKYMDEHAKKSVIEKEVTIQQKRNTDDKYKKYAFYIIALIVIGGFIMLAWKIHNGGK